MQLHSLRNKKQWTKLGGGKGLFVPEAVPTAVFLDPVIDPDPVGSGRHRQILLIDSNVHQLLKINSIL